MAAAPVCVDRVPEGERVVGWERVDDRASVHMQELHAPELASADLPLDLVEQRHLSGGVVDDLPAQFSHCRTLSNTRSYWQPTCLGFDDKPALRTFGGPFRDLWPVGALASATTMSVEVVPVV
jgi:hypothetical protein